MRNEHIKFRLKYEDAQKIPCRFCIYRATNAILSVYVHMGFPKMVWLDFNRSEVFDDTESKKKIK